MCIPTTSTSPAPPPPLIPSAFILSVLLKTNLFCRMFSSFEGYLPWKKRLKEIGTCTTVQCIYHFLPRCFLPRMFSSFEGYLPWKQMFPYGPSAKTNWQKRLKEIGTCTTVQCIYHFHPD